MQVASLGYTADTHQLNMIVEVQTLTSLQPSDTFVQTEPIKETESKDAWYQTSAAGTLAAFNVDAATGLSSSEVQARLDQHGPNELVERGQRSRWQILWEQITAVMVLVLIGAAVIKALLGEYIDAGVGDLGVLGGSQS